MEKTLLKPITVQKEGTIIFHSNHPEATIVQPFLSQFAQLMKTPSHIHIYKLSPFSIWYAFELGVTVDDILAFLQRFSGMEIPAELIKQLQQWEDKKGKLKLLTKEYHGPCLISNEKGLLGTIFDEEDILKFDEGEGIEINMEERGVLKQQLMGKGYPVLDLLGITEGDPLTISMRDHVNLRPYQKEAVASFLKPMGGSKENGFIILPCGSGKTIVGLGIMDEIKEDTLILVPNDTSLQQWYKELLEKTTLSPSDIGLYTSESKVVKPVTITTYQMLTYHKTKGNDNDFPHYSLFHQRAWGLVIYDEVHLLPAPLFRITSNLQGKRRIGFTATFVREDGKEGDIYSLIGPKRYEVGIKPLQENGWLSKPVCREVMIPLDEAQWITYLSLSKRERFRYVSENETKISVLKQLLEDHAHNQIIIIGQYLNQLHTIAEQFSLPLITGECPKKERQEIYNDFRNGKIKTLVLSRVANMAVDLPDAQVAIQVSGAFGSRQEEAQRIGRLLRPSKTGDPVYFYTLVSSMTQEEEFASRRQLFMQEQGYSYEKEEWYPCS